MWVHGAVRAAGSSCAVTHEAGSHSSMKWYLLFLLLFLHAVVTREAAGSPCC